MVILGIDPGLAKCGWALLSDDTDDKPRLGCWTTKKVSSNYTDDLACRVTQLSDEMFWLLDEYGGDRAVALEAPLFFGPKSRELSAVWGGLVATVSAATNGAELLHVTPHAVRKAWLGKVPKGKVDKKLYHVKVRDYYKLTGKHTEHALDALAVAHVAASKLHGWPPTG